jgi:Nucleotidyl transferase AbiEii toxin, Type IV TA system
MTDRRPGNLAHLERLIDTWSRDDTGVQATTGRLRRLVAVSVLATILDSLDHEDQPRLAFKGGASMEMRFGVEARASRDVDALVNVSFDEAFGEIAIRLHAGWEGFTGRLTDRTEITRAAIIPLPQRCKIKLAYRDKPFATLDFELGRAEADSFELLDRITNAVDMNRVQLGPIGDVTVLGVHYQIAQKLHACTEVPAVGTNARVHDLYDILLLAGLAENDGLHLTRTACEDTFTHRDRHAWPPNLPDWPDWPQLWEALDIPDDARSSYHDARSDIQALIVRIARA